MRDICSNRHRGNAASVAAFTQAQLKFGTQREEIYALLRSRRMGLTSKEIAPHFGWPLNAMSGRLTELKRDGKIRGTKQRRNGAEVLVAA